MLEEAAKKVITPTPPAAVATPLGGAAPQATVSMVRGTLRTLERSQASRLEYLDTAAKLEKQIIESRNLEQARPGAFVPVRRTH